MLAVQVELLTGRYVATEFNDRSQAEWPPHPARLFSAAVAAWADADVPDPAERSALEWWERQGHPTINCSWGDDEVSVRSPVTHFVPVNDASAVARDTSTTYRRLRSALADLEAARNAGDEKAIARHEKALARHRQKAADDSTRVTSTGSAPESSLQLLPENRERQARLYPTVLPADDRVLYVWPEADATSPHVPVLDGLLARIGRLGHSSSFVAVEVIEPDETRSRPTLVPDPGGWLGLRVASAGQLEALEAEFGAHQATEPRTLPALIATYDEARPASPEVPRSTFSDRAWELLSLEPSRRASVRDTLALTRAVRGALMRWAEPQPPPEILSGHVPGAPGSATAPSERPHLALAALPFVAHPHADGLVHALALILPVDARDDERSAVLTALRRWIDGGGELRLGERGRMTVTRLDPLAAPTSAQPWRWSRPARRWSTVTPIALDRFPGMLTHRDPEKRAAADAAAREVIGRACQHLGLPTPIEVVVRADAPVRGTRPARAFPRYALRGGRVQRMLVHADITFDEPVRGPLLVGAGRYFGYGLCTPLNDRSERGAQNTPDGQEAVSHA